MLESLMKTRNDWINKTGKFMFDMPILKHEQYDYLPSYYSTLAWLDKKISEAYQDELGTNTYPVKVKKVKKENYY